MFDNKILRIRLDLDEAITYNDIDKAKQLAQAGLHAAKDKELLGEVEYFQGQIEIINENYAKAIEHFDRAIEFNPKDGASYNDRALCMVELGVIDEAFEYFDRGIQAEPDFATIYHNKGWLLNKVGRHKEAIDNFNKALELDESRAVTYENLSDAYFLSNDFTSALVYLRRALDVLNPVYEHIREELLSKVKDVETRIAL
jgi:Flp pilus assembly protein TadD